MSLDCSRMFLLAEYFLNNTRYSRSSQFIVCCFNLLCLKQVRDGWAILFLIFFVYLSFLMSCLLGDGWRWLKYCRFSCSTPTVVGSYCRGRPRLVLVYRLEGLSLPRNSATINWQAQHDLVVDWAVKCNTNKQTISSLKFISVNPRSNYFSSNEYMFINYTFVSNFICHLLSIKYRHSNYDWIGYEKLPRLNLLLFYRETV